MSDKITEQERQAISSYVTGGGVVTRCPDGAAIGADTAHITVFSDWLAEQGLSVVPIRANQAKHLRPFIRSGNIQTNCIDVIFDKAA